MNSRLDWARGRGETTSSLSSRVILLVLNCVTQCRGIETAADNVSLGTTVTPLEVYM